MGGNFRSIATLHVTADSESNADLICAAPDLLAALKRAAADRFGRIDDEARAAIAAAEGKT